MDSTKEKLKRAGVAKFKKHQKKQKITLAFMTTKAEAAGQ